ncbi:MAG: hypothetical protein ABR946_11225 [Solirubrobacteraceae bacterium]
MTRSQSPRRVATFTSAAHVSAEQPAAIPISAVSDAADGGVRLTLADNELRSVPPIDPAEPK